MAAVVMVVMMIMAIAIANKRRPCYVDLVRTFCFSFLLFLMKHTKQRHEAAGGGRACVHA